MLEIKSWNSAAPSFGKGKTGRAFAHPSAQAAARGLKAHIRKACALWGNRKQKAAGVLAPARRLLFPL